MDQLFLLKPGFPDAAMRPSQLYFCPDCAMIEGVLGYYPQLRHQLKITYVDFARPRPSLIDLLGAENQSCPVLILSDPETAHIPESAQVYGRFCFINDVTEIMNYWALKSGIAYPH